MRGSSAAKESEAASKGNAPVRQSFGSHLAVMDAETVYHFGKRGFTMAHPKQTLVPAYFLAATAKEPQPEPRTWSIPTDVWVRSMMVTDKELFIAGPSGNWHTDPDDFEGKHAVLRSVDKATGKQVGEVRLDAAPVFNGMAAVGNSGLPESDERNGCLLGLSVSR